MEDEVRAAAVFGWIRTHPLMSIISIGLLVRAVVAVLFTYCYDVSTWATVIANMQAGAGLFELPGYYYTPVWGYFISFIGMVGNFLFGIDVFGTQIDSLVPIQGVAWDYYKVLITYNSFNVLFKVAFTLVDLAVSYLLYRIVHSLTGDSTKAAVAFGLWFLCPLVVYTSCVQAMFDSISVLFMVLTVYMLLNRNYLLAGMSFSAAAFSKFFPAYLIFIFLAYVIASNRGNRRECAVSVASSVIGASVMLLVIFIPDILNGTLEESFGFIFNRIESIEGESDGIWDAISSNGYTVVLLLQPAVFLIQVVLAYYLQKSDPDGLDRRFIGYCLLGSAAVFLWTPVPSYLLIVVPFLICHFLVSDRRYRYSLVAMFAIPVAYALVLQNYGILFQADAFLGIVSSETIVGGIEWLNQVNVLGMTNQSALNLVFGALETLAIYSVFITYISIRRADRGSGANGAS